MTAAEAIEALGGTGALATALGVVPSAVRNWRRVGVFPPRLHIAITEMAERAGVTLDRSLFQERTGSDRAA